MLSAEQLARHIVIALLAVNVAFYMCYCYGTAIRLAKTHNMTVREVFFSTNCYDTDPVHPCCVRFIPPEAWKLLPLIPGTFAFLWNVFAMVWNSAPARIIAIPIFGLLHTIVFLTKSVASVLVAFGIVSVK